MKSLTALKVIEVLCSTVARMCEGEWQDVAMSEQGASNELGYFSMIENKTASLFRAAGLLGAIVADADDEVANRFGEYGRLLGIAFQIQDDILGLVADEHALGKPVASDIRQRKVTLPLVHFMGKANAEQKIVWGKIAGRAPSHEEVLHVQRLFSQVGSIEYASQVAKSYAERAVGQITGIEKQEPYGQLLEGLARLSVVRRY
jgi:geranylgeranyl pyrophosphate synthase